MYRISVFPRLVHRSKVAPRSPLLAAFGVFVQFDLSALGVIKVPSNTAEEGLTLKIRLDVTAVLPDAWSHHCRYQCQRHLGEGSGEAVLIDREHHDGWSCCNNRESGGSCTLIGCHCVGCQIMPMKWAQASHRLTRSEAFFLIAYRTVFVVTNCFLVLHVAGSCSCDTSFLQYQTTEQYPGRLGRVNQFKEGWSLEVPERSSNAHARIHVKLCVHQQLSCT